MGSGSYVSASKWLDLSFGLLIPDSGGTEIFEPICRGMAEVQLEQRHVLLWGRSPADPAAMEAQARESCRQWIAAKVAGAFFAPLELTDRKDAVNSRIARLFETAGIPLILIDRDLVSYPQRSNHDLIGIDNRRAGYVLTEHMLQTGCKRLIFVGRHSGLRRVASPARSGSAKPSRMRAPNSGTSSCFTNPTRQTWPRSAG